MASGGAYLLTNQVMVHTHSWQLFGYSVFGMTLFPLMFGCSMLFFNGRSLLGWLLTLCSAGFIVFGIISRLDVYFRPTSLFNTIIMLVMLSGGIGLVARSLRSH